MMTDCQLILLVVGLDCLKCKLSEQEMSFFLPSLAVASWLQLRGASAKVKSLFYLYFFQSFSSGAYECTAVIHEEYVWVGICMGWNIKDIKCYSNFAHFEGISSFTSIFTENKIKSLWKSFFMNTTLLFLYESELPPFANRGFLRDFLLINFLHRGNLWIYHCLLMRGAGNGQTGYATGPTKYILQEKHFSFLQKLKLKLSVWIQEGFSSFVTILNKFKSYSQTCYKGWEQISPGLLTGFLVLTVSLCAKISLRMNFFVQWLLPLLLLSKPEKQEAVANNQLIQP